VQIEVTEYLLLLGAESFVFQFSIQNIKIRVYRTTVFLLFCMGLKLGQNKIKNTTRLPLLTHSRNCYTCNQTLKRKRRNILMTEANIFCETTNLFP